MTIYQAALIHSLSISSQNPWRSAMYRVLGIVVGAGLLSTVMAWGVRSLELIPPPHPGLLFLSACYATQLVVAVTLLAGSRILNDTNDTFTHWLHSLPLRYVTRASILFLPGAMLAVFALLLIVGPLSMVLTKLQCPLVATIAGMFAGVVSGLGLLYGLPMRFAYRLVVVLGVLIAEYKLLEHIVPALKTPLLTTGMLGVLFTFGIALCVRYFLYGTKHPPKPLRGRLVQTARLPQWTWFAKKLWRHKTITLNMGTAICLSAALAVLVTHQGAADPTVVAMFGALFAGSFAADMRGLAARHSPAEIAALRGTRRFVVMQIIVAYVCGLIIAVPLLWALPLGAHWIVLCYVCLGISAGLLAGTIIVPEPKDILSQLLAVFFIIVLLVGLAQLPFVADSTAATKAWIVAGLAACGLVLTLAIEYQRNTYTWRKNHAPE